MAGGKTDEGGNVEEQARGPAELAGEESADDRSGGPTSFEITEAFRSGVENIVCERDENDVGADDAGHHDRVREAERQDGRLLFQIGESFFQIGIYGETEAGFCDFGIFGASQGTRGDFGGLGVFTRLSRVVTRGNVAAAQLEKAVGGDEIGESVNAENPGDASTVIEKADERASNEHATLNTDEDGGISSGEFAGWNDFLNERVDGGPVHRGAHAGNERHGIEVPKGEVMLPGDPGSAEDDKTADDVEHDAEVTAVVAVNENAADEGDDQAGKGDDNDLKADGDSGVSGGKDVPADACKVHAAAEERDEHGYKEVAESTLGPNDGPICTGWNRGGHRTR